MPISTEFEINQLAVRAAVANTRKHIIRMAGGGPEDSQILTLGKEPDI